MPPGGPPIETQEAQRTSFQTPITIRKAVEHIRRNEFVLPAIQREFVWGADQICKLFDSLTRGYPIGSFLFWKVDREHCREYTFYGFLSDCHERDSPAVNQDMLEISVCNCNTSETTVDFGAQSALAPDQGPDPYLMWLVEPDCPPRQVTLDETAFDDDRYEIRDA